MMSWRERLALRAVTLRLARGEQLDRILAAYPRLTDRERACLRKAVRV